MKKNKYGKNAPREEEEYFEEDDEAQRQPEHHEVGVSKADMDYCRQAFSYYDREKKGYIEHFEIPIFLPRKPALVTSDRLTDIGFNLEKDQLDGIYRRIEEKNIKKIGKRSANLTQADVAALIEIMNIIKEMEMEDTVDQEDEYRTPMPR